MTKNIFKHVRTTRYEHKYENLSNPSNYAGNVTPEKAVAASKIYHNLCNLSLF
jgi:hypothetical protein